MMCKQIHLLAILYLCIFTLTGCIPYINKKFDKAEIDNLLVKNQYSEALLELNSIPDSRIKYKTLRKQIIYETKNYEKSQIKKSLKLSRQNQLYRAHRTLEDAIDNVPKSTALNKQLKSLVNKRNKLVQHKRNRLSLEYADYLKKSLTSHKQIAKWEVGNERFSSSYMNVYNEAEDLADHLIKIGKEKQNIKDVQVKETSKYFNAALKLSNKKSIKIAYRTFINDKRIKAKLKEQQHRARKEQRRVNAQQLKEQIALLKHNIKLKKFKSAKKTLDHAKKLSTSKRLNRKLTLLYQTALDEQVQTYYQQGTRYYSAEKYQLALKAWKKTRSLDPNHDMARKNITRVSKIIDKLNRLKKRITK
ncbi:MAG: hypothetical protein KAT04_03820 [Methylococcales bacterium]|nr:hypothetical protein [Methylococcales bacterium]